MAGSAKNRAFQTENYKKAVSEKKAADGKKAEIGDGGAAAYNQANTGEGGAVAYNQENIGDGGAAAHNQKFSSADILSVGLFALVLICWFALPLLQVVSSQDGESLIQNEGSAYQYMFGSVGELANSSPRIIAIAVLLFAAGGVAASLFRRRILASVLATLSFLWLVLPVYTDRKVLAAESGFYLMAACFFVCIIVNLVYVLKRRSMDVGFLLRSFIAMLFVAAVVQMFLGTVWCAVMYGKGFWFYFVPRAIKSLIQLPFNTVLAYYLVLATNRLHLVEN